MSRSIPTLLAVAAVAIVPMTATAQASLKTAFEAAWARQPEAAGLEARRAAAEARRRVAESWTAEPPIFEAAARNDRLGSNNGSAEYQAGLALPLWLPGERERSSSLAEAEMAALESRLHAAKLRVAADVREAFWAFQRASLDVQVAASRR
jgi:outer membrane protein, heavy metal efflux system